MLSIGDMKMKKALRIGYNRYYREDIFKEHLEYIKKNKAVIDEVTLFAEFSHYGYWDLENSAQNAEILKDRIKRYKEIGIQSVGINLLCTIGHTNEAWSVLPKADLQYQLNENGIESKGLLCYSNDKYLDYISKRYALYAATGADFIWMDDDLRLQGGCFCPKCIQKFNEINKSDYSRSELIECLKADKTMENCWNSFVDSSMLNLFATIKNAVKNTNPDVKIGYMSIPDNAICSWIKESEATKGRPGGGFYDERTPLEVFQKAFYVQYQIAKYPDYICDIQYEYEAFNYQSLNRSAHFSELESTLAIMSGCSGVLYNNDIFYDRRMLADMLTTSAKKWEILVCANRSCKPAGIYCAGFHTAKLLNEIGIPVTAYIENAVAAVILGDEWNEKTDEEITQIMNKNVFTDGKGMGMLSERGFSEYCGGQIKNIYDNGMAERFGNHLLNGNYMNYYRDVYMNFKYYINNTGNAYDFIPSEKAEIISYLETITHKSLGCSLYVYKHESGMRFAADGYLFPNSLCTDAKKEQLGNIIDWLTEGKLPVRIKKHVKIMPNVTTNSDGGMNVMLTNASFDGTGKFECVIRSSKKFYVINSVGEFIPTEQTYSAEETTITISNIDAWDYILLTNITQD